MGLVMATAYLHCSAVGSVTSCVQLFAARWIGAHQSLLSMGFSRQQYWSGHEELNEFIQEMEKAMATHSSALAWKIPWTEEPGGLQSMGLLGVGHD